MHADLLHLIRNFTLENSVILFVAAALYFMMEFKSKWSTSSFSFLIWLKQNWYNLVINGLAVLLYFLYSESVTAAEAAMMGLAPNWAIDTFMDLREKWKAKK